SGSANCSVLSGSINLKKYQLLPAHCGIVLVSLLPFMPVFGSTTWIQSLLARGDSPVPDGLISVKTGSSSGSSSSFTARSEEHTSELQSRFDLVCRLLLEKKKKKQ